MLVASPADYSAQGYAVTFDMAPRWVWGLAFTVAGSALLARRTRLTVASACFVLVGWSAGLWTAYWTGDGTTPTAGLSWACIAALTWWAAGKQLA
jgi:hypothetical protein